MDSSTFLVKPAGSRQDADRDEVGIAIVNYLRGQAEPPDEANLQDAVEGRKQIKVAALRHLVDRGEILRSGAGKKGDPYLYAIMSVGQSETAADIVVPQNSGSLVPTIYRELENQNLEKGIKARQMEIYSGSANLQDLASAGTRNGARGNQNPASAGLREKTPLERLSEAALEARKYDHEDLPDGSP
jgi:hypothetical protein